MKRQRSVIRCLHCGNESPHELLLQHRSTRLFEQIGGEKYLEPFDYFIYACGTCAGLSIFGEFNLNNSERINLSDASSRLYPKGPYFLPPAHMLDKGNPIPDPLWKTYEQAWPLQFTSPSAFAGQIRRALEFLCNEQGATGKSLYDQINQLATRGVLPAELLVDASNLIRKLGNVGVHSSGDNIDYWDAELLDDVFRIILDFVYVTPSKIARLKKRLSVANQ